MQGDASKILQGLKHLSSRSAARCPDDGLVGVRLHTRHLDSCRMVSDGWKPMQRGGLRTPLENRRIRDDKAKPELVEHVPIDTAIWFVRCDECLQSSESARLERVHDAPQVG